jgi:endonuclease-3 related protein
MKSRSARTGKASGSKAPTTSKMIESDRVEAVYGRLGRAYGPQRWWPVTPPGETRPRYTGGPRTELQRFEVAVGAILTQNTAWSNASRAIESLHASGLMSPEALRGLDDESLGRIIRSAGYYNQKAKRLKVLAAFFLSREKITRESLLALGGIGPETADSIMLYAFGAPFFVVDAYTRRMFERLGLVHPGAPYEEVRRTFEWNLPRRKTLYQEYHALIVQHGKSVCKKAPLCNNCFLKSLCGWYHTNSKGGSTKKRT